MSNIFMDTARSMLGRSRDNLIQEAREASERPPGALSGPRQDEITLAGLVAREVLRLHEEELETRRQWAQRIREEFAKYHEHSADGGECGACGSIQAANWMDPDYAKDGPLAEPFGAWRDRQFQA